MNALDLHTFALRGCQLIEASAGSGKTWTIAMLYVRLVLGPHDGADSALPPLLPPQILVVTFTEAATQELKVRIRQRLAQAASVFATADRSDGWPTELQPLAELRARYPRHSWPALARRLQLAADGMDEAAIATLHGWAWRVLREVAFASGTPFNLQLITDTTALRQQAIDDLWRQLYASLSAEQVPLVASAWRDPDALAQALEPVLRHARTWAAQWPDLAAQPLGSVLEHARAARLEALQPCKARARSSATQALAVLLAHGAPKVLGRTADVRRWLDALLAWADDEHDDAAPKLSDTATARLTPEHRDAHPDLPDAWRALDLWDTVPAVLQVTANLPRIEAALLRHAAVWVQQRIDTLLAERDATDFDGLLQRLADALDAPGGDALAQQLRARLPAALVDEFQDTDPVQLRILDRIYGLDSRADSHALILIGDPKQAIYAFRHADIHSYLQARRACAGRLWRLDTNWRSSTALVKAVNALFQQAEDRGPPGAFRFGHATDNPVPFEPARAQGRSDRWQRRDGTTALPALTLAHVRPADARGWSQERLGTAMAEVCAQAVAHWLLQADAGERGFFEPAAERWRPLRPGDIAVLVNTRHEAAALQAALQARGVASVFLSERESVYASDEAETLQRWLHACVHPRDPAAVRAALSAPTMGLSPAELHTWFEDEARWEATLERFERYHRWLHERGVLPAVRALLHDFDVAHRLLSPHAAMPDGERRLTNLLHLAELLQQASSQLSGPQALLRHLRAARAAADAGTSVAADEITSPLLRLDSERECVRLVTVHKSKGLEYPVVFYPFAMAARPLGSGQRKPLVAAWHDDEGRVHATLADETGERWLSALARADEERLAEDVRRFYVAVTRARHALWLGVAVTDRLGRSALGHLLGLPNGADDGALHAALQRLAQQRPADIVVETPAADAPPLRWTAAAAANTAVPGPARRAPPRTQPRWWTASYSALLDSVAADHPSAPAHHPDPADATGEGVQDTWLAEWHIAAHSAADRLAGETPAAELPGAGMPAPVSQHCGSMATEILAADPAAHSSNSLYRAAAAPAAWHRWPAGAAAGSVLHTMLEQCARRGWHAPDALPLYDMAATVLRDSAEPWARDVRSAADLAAWAAAIVRTPLPWPGAASAPLAAVARVQPELEFWLGLPSASARDIDAWVCDAVPLHHPRPPVRDVTLHGLLKGFIDLVVEHDGRYYVLDHKSNRLGNDDSAYAPPTLAAGVAAHRYDLQAVLYLLALHRLLRQRLPAYRPSHHLGGALVVFWRGVAHPSAGAWTLPAPLALIEQIDTRLTPGEACA